MTTSAPILSVDRRVARLAMVAFVLIPTIVFVAAAWREHWYPSGDLAQAELHVRGFFGHPPLVGAAGRIGTLDQQGSHPGPSMWVALLPTYLVFGRTANGLMVAMTVLQMVSIGAAVWVARKVGGAALAVAIFGALVLATHAAGPQFFLQPWNPWAAVIPFLVFLLLVTLVVDGRSAYLPWAVLVGSYCVQTHVGYALLVAGLLGVSLGTLVVRAARSGEPAGRPVRIVAWSAGALVLVWLPALVDQLRRKPGNLRILWHHFTEPDAPAVGAWSGFKAFAGEFNVAGGWLLGPRQSDDAVFWLGFVAMIVLFVGSSIVAVRRGRRTLVAAHAVVGLAAALGLFSITRVFGDFFEYTYRWMWMISAAAAALIVTNAWREVQHRGPWPGRGLQVQRAAILLAALVVLAAGTETTVNAATADIPAPQDSRLIGGVTDEALASLDPDARYLLRWHDPFSLGGVGIGVVLELERRDIHVGVDQWVAAAALPHRVLPEASADAVLWVVTGNNSIERFRHYPDSVLLGLYDQRSPAEQARSVELRAALEQRLGELGWADQVPNLDVQYGLTRLIFDSTVPADVHELAAKYSDLREPIAIFQVPPFGEPRP